MTFLALILASITGLASGPTMSRISTLDIQVVIPALCRLSILPAPAEGKAKAAASFFCNLKGSMIIESSDENVLLSSDKNCDSAASNTAQLPFANRRETIFLCSENDLPSDLFLTLTEL